MCGFPWYMRVNSNPEFVGAANPICSEKAGSSTSIVEGGPIG